MSIMDLLKSPRGIDLLEDLLDSVECRLSDMGSDDDLGDSYYACRAEIEKQQAIDRFKRIDGTPAEIRHKWTP